MTLTATHPCPRCLTGFLYLDPAPETWAGWELACVNCGFRIYDREPAPYNPGQQRSEKQLWNKVRRK